MTFAFNSILQKKEMEKTCQEADVWCVKKTLLIDRAAGVLPLLGWGRGRV